MSETAKWRRALEGPIKLRDLPWWFYGSFLEKGSLWLGWDTWPHHFNKDFTNVKEEYENKPLHTLKGISLAQVQTAGHGCNHHALLGFCFELPEGDPLRELCESYYESDIGFGPAPALEQVLELQQRLKSIDLDIHRTNYAKFEEAFFPLEFHLAFEYARSRKLRLLAEPYRTSRCQGVHSFDEEEPEFTSLEELDIWSSDQAYSYLRQGWEKVVNFTSIKEPSLIEKMAPMNISAFATVENCD